MSELHSVVMSGIGGITARGDLTLHGGASSGMASDGSDGVGGSIESFKIESFKLENYLASQKTYLDRCAALALAGCALALGDAALPWPPADADSFGITLGTHLGCVETMKTFWDKTTQSGVRGASPLLFSHSYFNTPISLCAIEFGLKGFHATFCAGHDSGLAAVRAAFDAIRLGHARTMLCGGVEARTPSRAVFEPSRADSALGEAAVFFVLEEAGRATQRGAAHVLPLEDAIFEAASQQNTVVRALYGDCGGAESALASADYLLTREP